MRFPFAPVRYMSRPNSTAASMIVLIQLIGTEAVLEPVAKAVAIYRGQGVV